MAALSEKTRISLPPGLWAALIGIILTGAGAWFATSAKAASADEASKSNSTELREHDKRITRVEDAQAWQRELLERIDHKLDRMQRKDER